MVAGSIPAGRANADNENAPGTEPGHGRPGRAASHEAIRGCVAGFMVDVAQLVRAPDCDSGGRGFKSRLPPHIENVVLFVEPLTSPAVHGELVADAKNAVFFPDRAVSSVGRAVDS